MEFSPCVCEDEMRSLKCRSFEVSLRDDERSLRVWIFGFFLSSSGDFGDVVMVDALYVSCNAGQVCSRGLDGIEL